MAELQHPSRVVSKRTGLSTHVIRVWEKRYGAVTPSRTDSNRRLYSDAEVDKLILLKAATDRGHSIGNLAREPVESLRRVLEEDRRLNPAMVRTNVQPGARAATRSANTAGDGTRRDGFIDDALAAIMDLNSAGLDQILSRSLVELGQTGLLNQIIVPLTHRIGDLWHDGTITVAHEHFASAALRTFLGNASRPHAIPETAPVLVVATPSGQLHELGAILVATEATILGWRVTYLGASLPAADIAGAAIQNNARAVALSIVFPSDDPLMGASLSDLRRFLPPDVKLLVGGGASAAYQKEIDAAGAIRLNALQDLSEELTRLRAETR
ncbi:MAG: MerR family transcriptional regulator [Opitutaceae bacterium]|nr:MerR family transcriptional regulator [Verrucomicrobiales bacterium]